jgi:hypothetical protein
VEVQIYVTSGEILMLAVPDNLLNVCHTDSWETIRKEIETKLIKYLYFEVDRDLLKLEFNNTAQSR